MRFLANSWYAAAWSEELTSVPFARRIADHPIVMYRSSSGKPVALLDKCPHRFAPLSKGKVSADNIACGYHGLTFAPSGTCIRNPFSTTIPAKAKVRSFPIVEAYTLVWIWMGAEEVADPDLIPDLSIFTQPASWRPASGYLRVAAHYEIVLDNLMDLSHLEFLHRGNLGAGNFATGEFTVNQNGDAIEFVLASKGTTAPPLFDALCPSNGQLVDFTISGRWDGPGIVQLHATTKFIGPPSREHVTFEGIHIVVPETETSCHYFYSGLRNMHLHDENLQQVIEQGLLSAFSTEDEPMVVGVQSRMADLDLFALHPVLLPMDGAAIRVRRRMKHLIAKESEASSPKQALPAGSV
ncbi:MAG TPA: aromatic ring-hydroxylating dioxygenase subunit alpha [Steroidobacteraceae bacterium]|jgi:vanillate O-demethylase monooxygenase subunit